MNSDETGRKIALAGALLAGITYFGVSILRDIFAKNSKNSENNKKCHKRRISDSTDCRLVAKYDIGYNTSLSHASSQTDLTLPIGLRHRNTAFRNVPPELWSPWSKTIEERIRELNIRLVNTTNFQFRNYSNYLKPHQSSYSLGNTPKRHSPALTSPEPPLSTSGERLFRSIEDLDQDYNQNSCNSNRSSIGIKRALDLCIPSETEISMHKRILEKLFAKSTPNLSQQDSHSLTILLMSRDEDLIIRTLSVIANCCAFNVNIDTICDSGCVLMLYELMSHKSKAVQIATTNAIANIANSERAQDVLKECIPLLVHRIKTSSDNDLQINWTLRALANLALKDCNQILMISAINRVMSLLSHSNPQIRLQAIKLLVNMSSNSELVPYLLAAKAPINLYSLLDASHDIELVLRLTNFLANVIDITCLREIRAKDLPVEYKASSPETLHSALYGYESTELLLKKLNDLLSIPHEDVVFQVKRILKKVR